LVCSAPSDSHGERFTERSSGGLPTTIKESNMNNAQKSKRLFPAQEMAALMLAVRSPFISEDRREMLQLAINQRDTGSSQYVPIAVIPQI